MNRQHEGFKKVIRALRTNKRSPYDPCITIVDNPMPQTIWIHKDWPEILDISEYQDENLIEYKHAESMNAFAYNLQLEKNHFLKQDMDRLRSALKDIVENDDKGGYFRKTALEALEET